MLTVPQGVSTDPEKLGPKAAVVNGKNVLQLLNHCSGSFRPGILTALVGSSGAGKTTLMDVLAGRKTSELLPRVMSFAISRLVLMYTCSSTPWIVGLRARVPLPLSPFVSCDPCLFDDLAVTQSWQSCELAEMLLQIFFI